MSLDSTKFQMGKNQSMILLKEYGSLRMAKYQNKNFRKQFLFHTKIKTTYQKLLATTEMLKVRLKQGSQ